MSRSCKNCKIRFSCNYSVPFPERGCSDFVDCMNKYVLLHHYSDTDFESIVAFGDDYDELDDIRISQPRYGSNRHRFFIFRNGPGLFRSVKDKNLINLCENVAQYLSIGEYAMLKKSYFKSQSWFERAKDSAKIASVIIDNY